MPRKTDKDQIDIEEFTSDEPSLDPLAGISIFRATELDLPAIYFCLQGYMKERRHAFPECNIKDSIRWGQSIIDNGIILVAVKDGKVVGSTAGVVQEFQWNRAFKYIHGDWLWVTPEYRQIGLGTKLVAALQEVSDKSKIPLIMGAIWGFSPEVLDDLKMKLGFSFVGGNYVYMPQAAE